MLTRFRVASPQVSANSGRSDADSEALEERELLALEEVMDHSDVHVRSSAISRSAHWPGQPLVQL